MNIGDYICLPDIPAPVRFFLGELDEKEVAAAGGLENFLVEQVKISKSREGQTRRRSLQFRLADQRKPYELALEFVLSHKH